MNFIYYLIASVCTTIGYIFTGIAELFLDIANWCIDKQEQEFESMDETTIEYNECFCHGWGEAGYATCCIECIAATPTCLQRKEHNENS